MNQNKMRNFISVKSKRKDGTGNIQKTNVTINNLKF